LVSRGELDRSLDRRTYPELRSHWWDGWFPGMLFGAVICELVNLAAKAWF
jgi:hypothetical protein